MGDELVKVKKKVVSRQSSVISEKATTDSGN
jgi:hypothetical protein